MPLIRRPLTDAQLVVLTIVIVLMACGVVVLGAYLFAAAYGIA